MNKEEIEQMRTEARQAEEERIRSQIIRDINRRVKRLKKRANEKKSKKIKKTS